MEWIELLEDATGRFADGAAEGDLAAPVPTCPGWTLADLVSHLGQTHTWAAHAVTDGNPHGDPGAYDGEVAGLVGWYRDAAHHLVDVLAARPEAEPAWAFGPVKTVGFWRRRQVHETLVHLYDVLAAQARDDEWQIAPALAWDGVDEVATLFYPRQVRLERIAPLAGTLRLVPTDIDAPTIAIGSGEPKSDVTGPASYLLRVVWKRAPVDDPVAAGLLQTAITP